jgi:ATP-dependent exoDNAse (exonuclease V) alpha subunit
VERLVEHVAHFDRRAVVQAAAEAARDGARLDEISATVEKTLASPEIVPLLDPSVRREQTIHLRDGRTISAAAYRPRYSTRAMLITERQLLDAARAGLGRDVGRADPFRIGAALARRPTLGDDQVEMVRRLCEDGAAVQVVIGKAGAGKTHSLQAAVEAWAESGRPVLGAAVARQAARNLERNAYMPATTIAALLYGTAEIPRSGVLVIDEAGMLPTRDLHELMRRTAERDTKLVLVGDPRQLPEIEAGGAFAALAQRLPAIELTQDRRQQSPERRELLDQLRSGDTLPALTALHQAGDLKLTAWVATAVESTVEQYLAALGAGQDTLMLAVRRREVEALNTRARELLQERGTVGPSRISAHGVDLAVGDRILLRVNDPKLDIQNGSRGVIEAIDARRRLVGLSLADGRRLLVGPRYLDQTAADDGPAVVHGYASTGHAAQGATVDTAFVLGGDAVYREWLYVAMSRARNRTVLIIPDSQPTRRLDTTERVERFAALAARSQRQTMAIEQFPPHDTAALLSEHIGDRPSGGASALRWDQALRAVTAYREADPDAPEGVLLGPRPRHTASRLRWTVALRAVERAQRSQARSFDLER